MAAEQKESVDLKLQLRYSDGLQDDSVVISIPNPNPINSQQDAVNAIANWKNVAADIGQITESDDGEGLPYQMLYNAYTYRTLKNTFIKDGVDMETA